MVFFTSILIVLVLYYLQSDGLVFVTIIALTAELINIFMTHTLTKSVKKKLETQHKRVTDSFAIQLKACKKNIKEFEKLQEDSGRIIYKANMKIKELEEDLSLWQTPPEDGKEASLPAESTDPPPKEIERPEGFNDLPDGSNRKL